MYFYANKATNDFCWLPVSQAEIKVSYQKGQTANRSFYS